MTEITTTPSGVELRCQEIDESDKELGTYVTYCKRYWGSQMKDYGDTTCPEADKYINDNKETWEEQAKQSKTQDYSKGEMSNHDNRSLVERDTIMSDEIDELEDNPTPLHSMRSMDIAGQMENFATNADYYDSCHLLYAMPESA